MKIDVDESKLVIQDGMLLVDLEQCTCMGEGAHEDQCGFDFLFDISEALSHAGYHKGGRDK